MGKILIKLIPDPDGNIKKIHDTDERVPIALVRDKYDEEEDTKNMLKLIRRTKSIEERNRVFIETLYEIDGIGKYQKVDYIY